MLGASRSDVLSYPPTCIYSTSIHLRASSLESSLPFINPLQTCFPTQAAVPPGALPMSATLSLETQLDFQHRDYYLHIPTPQSTNQYQQLHNTAHMPLDAAIHNLRAAPTA